MAVNRLVFDGNRYVAQKLLSDGPFSRVHAGYDVDEQRPVALKLLPLQGTHRAIAESMFRKEVGALESVNHPGIVKLYGHFQDSHYEVLVLVLELVSEGDNLEKLVAGVERGDRPTPALAWRLELLLALLSAVEFAHDRGVIHRDIKPSNVLLTQELRPKLADFGVARVLENYGRGVETHTLRDFFTRPYAAPEQLLRKQATPASDLHAFAILAASVLGLTSPGDQVEARDISRMLEPLEEELDAEQLREVEGVLIRGVSEQPARRPSAGELRDVLEALHAATEPPAPVYVEFTNAARDSFKRAGFVDEQSVLDDLNREVRARYEVEKDRLSGADRAKILCFGQNLEVTIVQDSGAADRVLVRYVRRLEPRLLRGMASAATPVHATLIRGRGSAEALIQATFDAYQAWQQSAKRRDSIRDLFALGRSILDEQRAQMTHLRINCRVIIGKRRRRGRRHSSAGVDGLARLRVESVTAWDSRRGTGDVDPLTWADALDERTDFRVDGRRVAKFRAFDPASQTLTVDFLERVDSDATIELELKDVALEVALRRQDAALRAVEGGSTVNPRLADLLTNPAENRCLPVRVDTLVQEGLSQEDDLKELVGGILGARDFFLVQGPPGTGKTALIAEVVAQILRAAPKSRILLASQTHDAVDNALARVSALAKKNEYGWRMVRDLPAARQGPGFEDSFRSWAERVRARSARAAEAEPAMDAQIRAALADWREGMEEATDVREEFASSLQLIATTCLRVPAALARMRDVEFDWVIIDEAGKATPPEVLVPLVSGRKFLLVGDHRQLPPFLAAETAAALTRKGLDPQRARVSLFEHLFERTPEPNRKTLNTQFRMHASIGSLIGDVYYQQEGGLATGIPDSARSLDVSAFDRKNRVFWYEATGRSHLVGTSWANDAEIAAVERVIAMLARAGRSPAYTVAVIAPYAEQVRRLRRRRLGGDGLTVECATVDSFQGREVDVVVYSFVRDIDESSKFVLDPRRLNVAFSRSKRLLVLIGCAAAAKRNPSLRPIIDRIPPANVSVGGTR